MTSWAVTNNSANWATSMAAAGYNCADYNFGTSAGIYALPNNPTTTSFDLTVIPYMDSSCRPYTNGTNPAAKPFTRIVLKVYDGTIGSPGTSQVGSDIEIDGTVITQTISGLTEGHTYEMDAHIYYCSAPGCAAENGPTTAGIENTAVTGFEFGSSSTFSTTLNPVINMAASTTGTPVLGYTLTFNLSDITTEAAATGGVRFYSEDGTYAGFEQALGWINGAYSEEMNSTNSSVWDFMTSNTDVWSVVVVKLYSGDYYNNVSLSAYPAYTALGIYLSGSNRLVTATDAGINTTVSACADDTCVSNAITAYSFGSTGGSGGGTTVDTNADTAAASTGCALTQNAAHANNSSAMLLIAIALLTGLLTGLRTLRKTF